MDGQLLLVIALVFGLGLWVGISVVVTLRKAN